MIILLKQIKIQINQHIYNIYKYQLKNKKKQKDLKTMDQNVPQVKNIQSYHDHFRKVSQTIKYQPVRQRTCNDKCCYIVFVIILIAFLGIGIFYIRSSDIRQIFKAILLNQDYSQYVKYASYANGFSFQNLKPAIPVISGMMTLTIFMAIIFLFLLVKFPKCIFATMLVLGGLLIAAITVLLFYIGALVPAIIMCVIFVVLICILACTFKKIITGIVLLNIASKFLMEKPSTFIAPIFTLIFVLAFEGFWAMSIAGITIYQGNAKTQSQLAHQQNINSVISFFWAFFNFFFSFFFYYCISFLIATAAGIWYYNEEENYIPRGVSRIFRYHLGSFTFASILVGIVSVTRQYTDKQARQGFSIATCCVCFLACCIKYMEDLLQTLNHNAIITMSVTGQSYFDSARSTLSLIFDNFPLFFLVDLMSHMVTIAGVIFICGVPGVLGFFLLRSTAQNPDDTTSQIVGTVIIVLFGMLVGGVFLSVLSQALSCMFIFFCLDRKFIQMGYPAPDRAPQQIKHIFNDLAPYVGGEYNQNYVQNQRRSHQPVPQNQNQNRNQSQSQSRSQNPYYRNDEPANPNQRPSQFY